MTFLAQRAQSMHSGQLGFWRFVQSAAYGVLSLLALISVPLAVLYSLIWVETAQQCLDTYFRREGQMPLYTTSLSISQEDLWSYQGQVALFERLDISSFSAAILAGFFVLLAAGGLRNTLWASWQDRREQARSGDSRSGRYGAAYGAALFPDYFDRLAVRLGLLGTLLSFLLAAIAHLAPDQTSAESSKAIFLLLCASLTSTFVGCTVAYLLVPFVELLNDLAAGWRPHSQPPPIEDQEKIFAERLASLMASMQRLDQTLNAMSATASSYHDLARSMAESKQSFDQLLVQLQRTTHKFQIVASELGDLRSTLIPHLENVAKLPARFSAPLKRMESAAAAVQSAATSSQTAFREIENLAQQTGPTVGLLGKVIASSLSVLNSVRSSLSSLDQSQLAQSQAVGPLPDLLRSQRLQLEAIGKRLELISGSNGSPPPDGASLAGLHELLRELQEQQTALSTQIRAVDPASPTPTTFWRRVRTRITAHG